MFPGKKCNLSEIVEYVVQSPQQLGSANIQILISGKIKLIKLAIFFCNLLIVICHIEPI